MAKTEEEKSDVQKWRRRADARPAELTAAAFRLFAAQGFAATRLEDVAAQAGVSKGTIYRYFQNKEALFEAVVNEAIVPRFAEAEALVEAFEGTSEQMLRALFNVFKKGLSGPFPAMIKLVVAESGNFPKLAELWAELVVSRALALIAKIVARGVDCGEWRAVKAETVAPLVGAPIILLGIYRQTLSDTVVQLDEDVLLETHLEMLLHALRPEGKNR